MQFGNLSNSIHSFFSLFTQSDQNEDGLIIGKEVVSLHQHQQQSDIFKDDARLIKVTDTLKRVNDDDGEEINASRKRLKVSMSESEKQRLMTFTRHSRHQKVKETHSKTISFVKVKQINPPKVRSINASANGFDLGIVSDLDENVPIFGSQNKIDHRSPPPSHRFPMDRKSFMPFVRPFSTPSNGFIGYRNYQSRARNVNNGFQQFDVPHQRQRSRHPFKPLVIMTKDDLIDEFLRDADPFQWSFPLPCHIEPKLKPNEKQLELCSSSSTVLESNHGEEVEEGQSDV